MTSVPSVLGLSLVKVSSAALLSLALVSGHAFAKNHDVQSIRIPAGQPANHDRAAGPGAALVETPDRPGVR